MKSTLIFIFSATFLLSATACKKKVEDNKVTYFTIGPGNADYQTREDICVKYGGVYKNEECSNKAANLITRCKGGKTTTFDEKTGDCISDNKKVADVEEKICKKRKGSFVSGRCFPKGTCAQASNTWDGNECVPIVKHPNFFRYCNKIDKTTDEKVTVDALIEYSNKGSESAKEIDCQLAFDSLFQKTEINLIENKPKLTALGPLVGLVNVKKFLLQGNKISDINPLKKALETIYKEKSDKVIINLSENDIDDINPILGMQNVAVIYLSNNPVANNKKILSLLNHSMQVIVH